jgi:hypothetical protein
MHRCALPLTLLTATVAAPSELSLEYAPEQEVRVTKTFETELALSYEELTSVMDGVEVPPEYLPELEIEIEQTGEIVVTDTVVELGDGRPAVLVRSYDTLAATHAESFSMTPPGVHESNSSEVESDLEGHTVRFEWSDAAKGFERAFESQGGDAALLEELIEDMDLRGFLPETSAIEEGARWIVPGADFAAVLAPGGDVALEREDDEWADAEVSGPEGELAARLLRVVEQDGLRLAEIAIEGEVVLALERTTDLAHVPVADGSGYETSETTYEVEGHVWWNVDAGRAHSFELGAEVTRVVVTRKDEGQPGPEFESTVRFSGTWHGRLHIERPD